ncbi:MAG TPA: hypothetical protein VMV10_05960, partial [Pirellulales bacterium]|nr:hypothetical protein [Pirellulales bacterium]
GKNNAQREVGRLFSPRPISAPTGTERRFCPKAERIHRISLGMARLHPFLTPKQTTEADRAI